VQRNINDQASRTRNAGTGTGEFSDLGAEAAWSANPLSDQERAYLTLLFNKYRGPLYRYLRGLVRSGDDVAELVQETYFRIMRHSKALEFETVARAYLFRTATNVAREYYRRRRARRADQHVALEDPDTLIDTCAPQEHAIWEEALSVVRVALQDMPHELRDVFVLHRFQQQTYSEIANALGVSTRTIERRMSQAMDFLAVRTEGVL
jgi:RNA polymerase sigma-70 factor (ECF subfamily)